MSQNNRPRILGIAASLRNARRGLGNVNLIEEIKRLKSKEELKGFLEQEAATHLANFAQAGRDQKAPFDELYKNLKKNKGDKGLSNSEILLATSLWAAHELNADIDYISLSEYFTENNEVKNVDDLKEKLFAADGLLLSTPVYFGDRGSLAQTFINFIRDDQEVMKKVKNKVYAGCAVGAKRNGGQETTLIYQLWDMVQLGLLGVGNDSETTSQYGGTGHAGDVGMMQKDDYGLDTALGTGRRIARVAGIKKLAEKNEIKDGGKIGFLFLQDKEKIAENYVKKILADTGFKGEAVFLDISNKSVKRCLACDICPTHVDVDSEYRCIIKAKSDDMSELHNFMLDLDALIPVAFSSRDRAGLVTNYQRFMERTRYLRRGDYVLSDLVSAPLIIEELGAHENLALRMLTSTLRHHTILTQPITLYLRNGDPLNLDAVQDQFKDAVQTINNITAGRLVAYSSGVDHLKYNPVGYVLSSAKDKEDQKLQKRRNMIEVRVQQSKEMATSRVVER